MTRKEYIAALDQYLVTMSASEKADILSDYEEHFRVGLENGKTESQIAASLGSPYDVANQFLEGEKPKTPTYPARTAATASTTSTTATGQRPAQTASAQTYTTRQRPAQTATSQGYTTQQRPAQTAASQGYTTQPRPTQTAGSQLSQTTQANPYRTAQTAAQSGTAQQPQRQIYDVGIQNYAQAQGNQQGYSQPNYQSQAAQNNGGYVDYDRQAAERPSYSAPSEGKYNSTGIILLIVLCVVLIPTVGSTLVGLLAGLYGAVVGFAAAGGSLIAVGAALSATSIWTCVGLVFIGISFLLLTGLLVIASIEGTKLFVKLIKYCIKEGKKLVTEGSF